jgi:hypothetical protein
MSPDPAELPPLENRPVASLYLANQFARSGCPRLSHLLLHQLEVVVNHSRDGVSPTLQEICKRPYESRQHIHAEHVSAPTHTKAQPAI